MELSVPLILASKSPRRRLLLEQIGIPFTIEISHTEETIPEQISPSEIVQSLALQKAETVADRFPEALTLGADTIVVLNNSILGKPVDEDEAREMLRRLSGNTHTVYTGLALVHPITNRQKTAFEKTDVTFASMSEEEIYTYVSTGSPLDKAGAYGIQDDRGALFISGIHGDYYNVVGLPLHRLYHLLKSEFPDLWLSPRLNTGTPSAK